MENCLLLFTANTNILILLYRELKTDDKSFIFCRLPFVVNVMLNLSSVDMFTWGHIVLCLPKRAHVDWTGPFRGKNIYN